MTKEKDLEVKIENEIDISLLDDSFFLAIYNQIKEYKEKEMQEKAKKKDEQS